MTNRDKKYDDDRNARMVRKTHAYRGQGIAVMDIASKNVCMESIMSELQGHGMYDTITMAEPGVRENLLLVTLA